jgi:hypothetical protein
VSWEDRQSASKIAIGTMLYLVVCRAPVEATKIEKKGGLGALKLGWAAQSFDRPIRNKKSAMAKAAAARTA